MPAIEIKSFSTPSPVTEFHQALGQFLNYLAVPLDSYEAFFTLPFAQSSVKRYQVGLIVYDPSKQEIRTWIGRSSTAT